MSYVMGLRETGRGEAVCEKLGKWYLERAFENVKECDRYLLCKL